MIVGNVSNNSTGCSSSHRMKGKPWVRPRSRFLDAGVVASAWLNAGAGIRVVSDNGPPLRGYRDRALLRTPLPTRGLLPSPTPDGRLARSKRGKQIIDAPGLARDSGSGANRSAIVLAFSWLCEWFFLPWGAKYPGQNPSLPEAFPAGAVTPAGHWRLAPKPSAPKALSRGRPCRVAHGPRSGPEAAPGGSV